MCIRLYFWISFLKLFTPAITGCNAVCSLRWWCVMMRAQQNTISGLICPWRSQQKSRGEEMMVIPISACVRACVQALWFASSGRVATDGNLEQNSWESGDHRRAWNERSAVVCQSVSVSAVSDYSSIIAAATGATVQIRANARRPDPLLFSLRPLQKTKWKRNAKKKKVASVVDPNCNFQLLHNSLLQAILSLSLSLFSAMHEK